MRKLLAVIVLAFALSVSVDVRGADAPVADAAAIVMTPPVPASAKPAAAPAIPEPSSAGELVQEMVKSGQAGNYRALASGLLIMLVWVLRWLGAEKMKFAFLATKRGGALLALATGIVSWGVTEAASGQPLGMSSLVNGITTAVMAAGGWTMFRDVIAKQPAAAPATAS